MVEVFKESFDAVVSLWPVVTAWGQEERLGCVLRLERLLSEPSFGALAGETDTRDDNAHRVDECAEELLLLFSLFLLGWVRANGALQTR